MLVVGIAIADFHCITIEPLVQRTLAAAVVFATSVNERQYINSFIAQNIAGVCRYGKVTLYQVQYEALAGKVACTAGMPVRFFPAVNQLVKLNIQVKYG